MKAAVTRVLLCLSLVGASACAERDPDGWIASALADHHEVDRQVAQGDAAGAIATLERALSRDAPRGVRTSEVRIVRQDLLYRLSDLQLRSGRVADALGTASRGLELGRGRDAFTTNLLIARGRALESSQDPVAASRDYHDALLLTESLLNDQLREAKK